LATHATRPRNLVRLRVYLPQPRIRSKVDSEYKNQLFLASGSNFGERQDDQGDGIAIHRAESSGARFSTLIDFATTSAVQ
jgi:hypothetical protein